MDERESRSRGVVQEGRRAFLLGLPLLLLIVRASGSRQGAASLWDVIESNNNFSTLVTCAEKAGPSLVLLLKDTNKPHTLFAPTNEAFAAEGGDPCGDDPTIMLRYLISGTASTIPYIGEAFPTLLGGSSNLYAFAISKDNKTPANLPPINYINNAHGLGWLPVGKSILVPLAGPVLRPPRANGSIWDVLVGNPDLSKTVELISKLPSLQEALSTPPNVKKRTGYYTLFAPDNAAWATVPTDRMERLESSTASLSMLFNYHLLSKGSYPRSTTGMFYSEQFFPTSSAEPSVIYSQFYRAQTNFTGLRLTNAANILLDVSKEDGKLVVSGIGVKVADLGGYNGVVHVLEGVLPLPDNVTATVLESPYPLSVAGNFTTLARLVQAAPSSFRDFLEKGGPLTLLAPTDVAFAEAFESGQLPALEKLVSDPQAVSSLLAYHTLNSSSSGLFLFNPTDQDPFADDFKDGVQPQDVFGRRLTVHRHSLGTRSSGAKVNDTVVYLNSGRLYQCTEGGGWGHDCGSAHAPTPSNTYAINEDHIVNMIHAIDEVLVPPQGTLIDALSMDPSLSAFLSIVQATNLSGLLSDTTAAGMTVFAPTNASLALLRRQRPWIFESPGNLTELVKYHIIPATWFARWLDSEQRLPTLALDGAAPVLINTSISSAAYAVNRLAFMARDSSTATNGVLHQLGQGEGAMTTVLVPDVVQMAYAAAGLYNYSLQLLLSDDQAVQEEALHGPGHITLLGPTDSAYASWGASSLPSALVKYHIVRGLLAFGFGDQDAAQTLVPDQAVYPVNLSLATSNPCLLLSKAGVYVNGVPLEEGGTGVGIAAINGMVYRLSAVLRPPEQDLAQLMRQDEDMQAFYDLLADHGLTDLLSGPGPLTIFVPRGSVLGRIYRGNSVFSDKAQAKKLLLFHMMDNARLFAAHLGNLSTTRVGQDDYCPGTSLRTMLAGQELSTQIVSDNQTFVSPHDQAFGGELVRPNILGRNGVLHLMEGFLTYPGYRRPK